MGYSGIREEYITMFRSTQEQYQLLTEALPNGNEKSANVCYSTL